MPKKNHNGRVVVVGASSGGVQAACSLLEGLPADFPWPVFVVIHIGTHSALPAILSRCGRLPAVHARDNERIVSRRIYVAPPDAHLLLEPGRMKLSRGPRENRTRPAVDPLFRSAARAYRERAIGIVLTGGLDDGTAGLFAIKARKGIAIVQDPIEAMAPSMPQSARTAVAVDYCLPVAEIAPLLVKLSRKHLRMSAKKNKSRANGPLARGILSTGKKPEGVNGEQVPLSCPDCQGPLFKVQEGKVTQYHCLVGHTFSPKNLSAAHSDVLERAMWVAIRAFKEKLTFQRLLAEKHAHDVQSERKRRISEEIKAIERDIVLLEEIHERL